jgi:KDO2-lipid IV(A) lauroyltransferase
MGCGYIDKEYAAKESMRVLQRNEIVGMIVDQRVGSTGILVNFFNRPVTATPFPALMQIKYGSRLYPIFSIRERLGCFHVQLGEEIVVPEHITDKQGKIHYIVQAYTKAIEDIVRKYPEQWLWYHRRWRL